MKNLRWLRPGPADNSPSVVRSLLPCPCRDVAVRPEYSRPLRLGLIAVACLGFAAGLVAKDDDDRKAPKGGHYLQTNLVSDVPGLASQTDPHLVNPWGLSASTAGPWWVSDNGTGFSTLYNGTGAIQSLVVTIPNLPGVTDPSAPTGTVFNGVATDFLVADGKPAHFLFVTEEGTVAAWNSGPNAVIMVNNSGKAVYKGMALAANHGANFIYAVNFQAGTIDVFNREFKPVALGDDAFTDKRIPGDYAPFNVQAVGESLYVTFAKKEAGSIDELHGPGRGFVDVFSPDGKLQKRLEWGAWFNAPWGVALAPDDFGAFGGTILVGQFGSGKIAAFDPRSGEFRGLLRGEHGRPIIIEGLWALAFGNGANAGPATTLFFTAGPDDEAHGLFGTLTPRAKDDANDNGDEDDDPDGRH